MYYFHRLFDNCVSQYESKIMLFFGIIKIMALFFDKIGVLMLVLLIYSMFFGVKGVNRR